MKTLVAGLTLATALSAATANAETVVIQDNRADANHLLTFDVSHKGQLKEKAEVATGGKGFADPTLALGPYDSDQEVITNRDHTLLLTVNGGSNTISVFCLLPNGKWIAAPGSPYASHGSQPVSLGLNGNLLTVVNKHGDPAQAADTSLPNYTNFIVTRNGSLKWIPGSTVNVDKGASPSQASVREGLPFVFGADFLSGQLQSFQVLRSGHFQPNEPLDLPNDIFPMDGGKTPHALLGLAIHPKTNLIYVGLPTINKIGIYRFDRYGALSFVRAFDDTGAVVCWLTMNKSGTRLYASNTADASITVYDVTKADQPVEIQKLKLPSKGGTYQIALNARGDHLGVVTQRFQASTPQGEGNELHLLNVAKDGRLSEASMENLTLPNDTRPQGIAFID